MCFFFTFIANLFACLFPCLFIYLFIIYLLFIYSYYRVNDVKRFTNSRPLKRGSEDFAVSEAQHIPYYRKLTLVFVKVFEINAT